MVGYVTHLLCIWGLLLFSGWLHSHLNLSSLFFADSSLWLICYESSNELNKAAGLKALCVVGFPLTRGINSQFTALWTRILLFSWRNKQFLKLFLKNTKALKGSFQLAVQNDETSCWWNMFARSQLCVVLLADQCPPEDKGVSWTVLGIHHQCIL